MELTLIGGGGHCCSLLQMIPSVINVRGYTDVKPVEGMTIEYLGTDEGIDSEWVHIAVALGTNDSLSARRKLIDRLTPGHKFLTLIASTATCVNPTELGAGSAVMHGSIINGAKIGKHCIINSGAIIEHGVTLGENCFIGPGATICGGVEVGSDVIIGANATIRNGIKICSGAIIGMAATVVSDILSPGTYAGNPARRMQNSPNHP